MSLIASVSSKYSKPDPNKPLLADGFDEPLLRGLYDRLMPQEQPAIKNEAWIRPNPRLQWIVEQVIPKALMLDIGCGNAEFLLHMVYYEHCFAGIGIDISGEMVEVARQGASALLLEKRVAFFRSAIEHWDKSGYGLISMNDTLEHLFSPVAAIKKCATIMDADGYFVGLIPHAKSCNGNNDRHLHHFEPEELGVLMSAFFKDVHIKLFEYDAPDDIVEGKIGWVCRDARDTDN